ncbi:hypothetical protein HYALB_00012720 [Hymenoscyphus albidus]|uniref:Uncharacterized protein n=1 Tax=Hymenoscyphus albidus TaxID=595503 RepID=A0A9N9QA25_9HELO|nr:hypothetical protein HYALB_00012720 [Hymenoscyphus albidus]
MRDENAQTLDGFLSKLTEDDFEYYHDHGPGDDGNTQNGVTTPPCIFRDEAGELIYRLPTSPPMEQQKRDKLMKLSAKPHEAGCRCFQCPPSQHVPEFLDKAITDIRCRIYDYCFILDDSDPHHTKHREYKSLSKSRFNCIGFLLSCKTIYMEASQVIYKRNNFIFWPTTIFNVPNSVRNIFPALPLETHLDSTGSCAQAATEVVFCQNNDGPCTQHQHAMFEVESPTLSFLKMIGPELSSLITNITLMVHFPIFSCGNGDYEGIYSLQGKILGF